MIRYRKGSPIKAAKEGYARGVFRHLYGAQRRAESRRKEKGWHHRNRQAIVQTVGIETEELMKHAKRLASKSC